MAKLFKTSEDVYEFIDREWQDTDLPVYGVMLKVISTPKAKQILKLSKASATTEYLLREEAVLTLVVYEAAWDRLSDLYKTLLIRGVFSTLSYDTEKDRLNIDTKPYADLFNMRHSKDANGNEILEKYDNALETASIVISQLEEEEQEAKEAAKEAKRTKKAQGRKEMDF